MCRFYITNHAISIAVKLFPRLAGNTMI